MKNNGIKLAAVAAAAVMFVGCDEIKFDGLMSVNAPITFAQKVDNATQNITVNPGQFSAKATIGRSGNKNQIKLQIANAEKPTTVVLSFDKNINIGETFNISAAALKQNFDLAGTMATKVERGQEQWGRESCTYQEPQTVCRYDKSDEATEDNIMEALGDEFEQFGYDKHHTPTNPQVHTPVCHTVWVSRPGWQDVRYYYETTLRDIDANFVQAGTALANYKGHSSQTEKVITYQGRCGW